MHYRTKVIVKGALTDVACLSMLLFIVNVDEGFSVQFHYFFVAVNI